MIPELDENGNLLPGFHRATIAEVVERFGHGSEEREACAESLLWLVPLCRRAGVVRMLINGSFVTDRAEPGDVDCVLIPGPAYRLGSKDADMIDVGLPYLSIEVARTRDDLEFFENLFASDKLDRPKGVIEVIL